MRRPVPQQGSVQRAAGALHPWGWRAAPLLPANGSEAGRRVRGGGEVRGRACNQRERKI